MGPDQHAQLDSFGTVFPFPIRIAAVLVAGKSPLMGNRPPKCQGADDELAPQVSGDGPSIYTTCRGQILYV